ncbi:hypothetical protein ACHWQZ_G002148 [Mnemiopsis leidyi]
MNYSEKYADGKYEYRHVTIPKDLVKRMPKRLMNLLQVKRMPKRLMNLLQVKRMPKRLMNLLQVKRMPKRLMTLLQVKRMPKRLMTLLQVKRMPKRLMTEDEWRRLGVQQSRGWEHYMIHSPEPQILCFRRNLNYTQQNQ